VAYKGKKPPDSNPPTLTKNGPDGNKDALSALSKKPAKLLFALGFDPTKMVQLQQQVIDLHKQLADAQKDVTRKTEEVVEAQKEVVEAQKEVVEAQKEVVEAQKDVTRKTEEVVERADRITQLKLDLVQANAALDRIKGRSNLRGIIEYIAQTEIAAQKLKKPMSNTAAIEKLFDDSDSAVGKDFMAYLRKNLATNGVVEKDVVKEGKSIYGHLSGFAHGTTPVVEIHETNFNNNQLFVLGCILSYWSRPFLFYDTTEHQQAFPFTISP